MKRLLVLVAIVLAAGSTRAIAAQWIVGSASAQQGSTVTIPVWLSGDGSTSDASIDIIFDEGRLRLPVEGGPLPGASVNGADCVRIASNRIRVLSADMGGSPIASGWMQQCALTFSVSTAATPGSAWLQGSLPTCWSLSGAVQCVKTDGFIIVTGVPVPPGYEATAYDHMVEAMLVDSALAPLPETLASFDYTDENASTPLHGLNYPRPVSVKPFLARRARGAFKAYLLANPSTARAELERYVIVEYADGEAARLGRESLARDPLVQYVSISSPVHFSGAAESQAPSATSKGLLDQVHLDTLRISDLWSLAGGWSLLGMADSGVAVNHPELQSWAGLSFYGGNLLPALSFDANSPNDVSAFDERPWVPATLLDFQRNCAESWTNPACQANTPGEYCMRASYAGHGTHVAGLATANPDNGGVQGTCRNCGIISAKLSAHKCEETAKDSGIYHVTHAPTSNGPHAAITRLVDSGAQVVSLSAGSKVLVENVCRDAPTNAWCKTLTFAAKYDVLVVAAAGNERTHIDLPAHDSRVLAVGGVDADGSFWDFYLGPRGAEHCPYAAHSPPNFVRECGSNYTADDGSTQNAPKRRQELVAPAIDIRSSFYPDINWSAPIRCGDQFGDGTSYDGIGLCTGTSMATPQISGIVGALRSINPLVMSGDPEDITLHGIRDVLVETTDRWTQGVPWDRRLGYGIPNAGAAARRVLGTVRGYPVLNRVTPLFTMYSSDALDFASVATPQGAMALLRFGPAAYSTVVVPPNDITRGYYNFPSESGNPSPDPSLVPRAGVYVLTTEFSPAPGLPAPVPLFWLERKRRWPTNCADGPGCAPEHRDHVLVESSAIAQQAIAAGYAYRGRQGFIYPLCANGSPCMPSGTVRLLRRCNTSVDDCAVFPESQLAIYQTKGYTSAFLTGGACTLGHTSPCTMGYVYPNVDSDNDGLVDGMELIIGTDPTDMDGDSDNDTQIDSNEFPQASVQRAIPLSDPCDERPGQTCPRAVRALFLDGFE